METIEKSLQRAKQGKARQASKQAHACDNHNPTATWLRARHTHRAHNPCMAALSVEHRAECRWSHTSSVSSQHMDVWRARMRRRERVVQSAASGMRNSQGARGARSIMGRNRRTALHVRVSDTGEVPEEERLQ
mmetsp:Transcript_68064/g.134930  ORF Transcript_68064/g.134930 Transcript_68064/m.134930 type:complete len:133 (-) Transcript_68064:536-934(-)